MSSEVTFVDFVGLDEDRPRLTPEQKMAMVSTVEETGNIRDAAILEGIMPEDLEIARRQDQNFDSVLVQAEARLKIRLRKRIYDLAFEDREIPIIGGLNRDEVIDHETKTHERMVELAAKLALGDELVQRVKQTSVNANVDARLAGKFDLSEMSRSEQRALEKSVRKALNSHDSQNR